MNSAQLFNRSDVIDLTNRLARDFAKVDGEFRPEGHSFFTDLRDARYLGMAQTAVVFMVQPPNLGVLFAVAGGRIRGK